LTDQEWPLSTLLHPGKTASNTFLNHKQIIQLQLSGSAADKSIIMNIYQNKEFEILQDNNGNKIARLLTNTSDLFFIWGSDRVEFSETKQDKHEQSLIRAMYIKKDSCKIQFRGTQSLGGKQKERHLMASAFFSREDLEFLLEEMKKQQF
jgi:hypothetical protein